jgi:CelD/BcsL family acetyltransferase involved in cellulose biosynthesis
MHHGNDLQTLLVFRLLNRRIEVLNEVICLSAPDMRIFADHVFAQFPQVDAVGFRAVHAPPCGGPRPSQRHDYLEDTVVTLPSDSQAYQESMSKNARRNVKRAQRGAADLDTCTFQVYGPGQAPPAEVRAIIALNHARMAGKNKRSGLDNDETRRILVLVESCGLVGVIKVDGVVRAGGIACRTGDNYFLLVLAHDPAYDDYSLGFLCCYQTICACIERGGRQFHFLWGRYAYKQAFGGQLRELYRIVIYRSRPAMLRQAGLGLRTWRQAMLRRAMLWLHERSQQPTPAIAIALGVLRRWRQWRNPSNHRNLP